MRQPCPPLPLIHSPITKTHLALSALFALPPITLIPNPCPLILIHSLPLLFIIHPTPTIPIPIMIQIHSLSLFLPLIQTPLIHIIIIVQINTQSMEFIIISFPTVDFSLTEVINTLAFLFTIHKLTNVA